MNPKLNQTLFYQFGQYFTFHLQMKNRLFMDNLSHWQILKSNWLRI